jgi:ATP-dependent RNA helicase DDX5/DBP2
MTVDFNQRKSAKRQSKRMSQKTEDGRRIRGGKSVPRKQRGMCSSDPPLPPKLREEDELRAAKARNERKKAEKLKAAARALREKMHAKGVPGAAKPLSMIKGPSRADDADNISDSDDADDDAVPVGEEDSSAVPDYFLDALRALGHKGTTPIQRECWPHCCAGRDVLGIAPPGSGKTLAYLLPAVEFALRDARDRPRTKRDPRGRPSALVVAPTRELALQVAGVCGKLRRAAPVRCVAVYGGASQEEQEEQLAQPSSLALLVVGTPGRITATLETDALGLERARMLVLDEADRMLALGFADQLEVIRKALPGNERDAGDGDGDGALALALGMGRRPGRQTLLFSATFPKTVRAVAKTWLAPKPAIVKIESADKSGDGKRSNEANVAVAAGGKGGDGAVDVSNVDQTVHVCAEHKKARKLLKHVTDLRENDGRSKSRVLVFANRIKTVNFVGETLRRHGEKVGTLHGELKQDRREQALKDFKSGKTPCLVATDVAGRGLDITGLEHVVNWDMPGSVEQYTHRVGRAGRSGRRGAALSFFTRNMAPLAPDLVALLKRGGHFVDPNLEVLAKVGEALIKNKEVDMGDADVEEDKEVEADEEEEDADEEAEDEDEEGSDDDDEEEESDESEEEDEMESEEDDDEDEDDEMESEEEEASESEEAPAADAGDVMDQLVEMFRSENGRDPNEKELVRWIKTLRDAGDGPISFEENESGGESDESDEDEDESESDEPAPPPAKKKAEKKRASEREAEPAAAKKAKTGKTSVPVEETPAAEFIASKKFAGAKPGYYFKKGPKGVGYYVDKNAPPRLKKSSAAQTPAKKSSVFSIPREQADFQPAKKFAGAKKGFVFKKGPKGLGYYLDLPPKVTFHPRSQHRPGSSRGGQRGDWAKGVGGGGGGGGKKKGGRRW